MIVEGEYTELLLTDHVVKVSQFYAADLLTEMWMRLWGRAIIYSLATVLLNSPELAAHVSNDNKTALRNDFSKLLRNTGKEARSPYVTIRELIRRRIWTFALQVPG